VEDLTLLVAKAQRGDLDAYPWICLYKDIFNLKTAVEYPISSKELPIFNGIVHASS